MFSIVVVSLGNILVVDIKRLLNSDRVLEFFRSSLPKDIKNSSTLSEFKRRLISWDGNICNCRLCKVFILGVGFL